MCCSHVGQRCLVPPHDHASWLPRDVTSQAFVWWTSEFWSGGTFIYHVHRRNLSPASHECQHLGWLLLPCLGKVCSGWDSSQTDPDKTNCQHYSSCYPYSFLYRIKTGQIKAFRQKYQLYFWSMNFQSNLYLKVYLFQFLLAPNLKCPHGQCTSFTQTKMSDIAHEGLWGEQNKRLQ